MPEERIIAFNPLAFAVHDKYPVTALHTSSYPSDTLQHSSTFLSPNAARNKLLDKVRAEILQKDASVSGFNIGMNNGDAAGQTVGHAHVHLIPRREDDIQDPRGGVRCVIPGKAIY
jgi:diadenosine tetraphosphate (Ap4A) HIT family hydrolase